MKYKPEHIDLLYNNIEKIRNVVYDDFYEELTIHFKPKPYNNINMKLNKDYIYLEGIDEVTAKYYIAMLKQLTVYNNTV